MSLVLLARFLDFARNDTDLILFNYRDRHCRDAFAAADRTEPLVRRRLNAHLRVGNTNRRGNFFSHRWNLRRNLWRLRDHGGVDVDHPRFFLGENSGHPFQDLDAADAANRFVRVWKMLTNVAGANRAEQRIRDGVR